MRTIARSFGIFVILLLGVAATFAHGAEPAGTTADDDRPSISQRLSNVIDPVRLDHATAKQAFDWWSHTTGVPLVINWDKLATDGIDPQAVITLDLRDIPARQLLTLIMQQMTDQPMIFEGTPWYVGVTTKAEANKHMVLRYYDVGDLIFEPAPVTPPPDFDLSAAPSNSNSSGSSGTSSGSGGGSSNSIFGGSPSSTQTEKARSEKDRSEDLAKVIRDTIEPDIWVENGGTASIRFYNGRLIVNAPPYVQIQIGTPEPTRGQPTVNREYVVVKRPAPDNTNISKDVAGVATQKPTPVAGVAGK